MTETEHLLACLAEEASEIAKECNKTLRFGLHDTNVLDPDGPDQREKIWRELNDLFAVATMLWDRGIIPDRSPKLISAKRAKVEYFMQYARNVGTLK